MTLPQGPELLIILAVLAAGRPDGLAEVATTLAVVLVLVALITVAAVGASQTVLPVVFRLADRDTLSLPEAVALVSDHPARAVGLDHIIGKIQTGYIADLVVVRRMPDPVVQQVFVGGRPVYTWAEQHEGLPVAHQVV